MKRPEGALPRLSFPDTMLRLRRLLPLLLAAGALLAIATPAQAAKGLEIALQDDAVFLYQSHYNREKALRQARDLGVSRLRVNVAWARVLVDPGARTAPARPVYNWAPYDDLIAAAARHGIKLQLTLTGPAPAWASTARRIGTRSPDFRAFGRFVADAALHFHGRVDRYSIWNEPNWHTLLEPSVGCRKGHWPRACDARLGSLYRRLYIAGQQAIAFVDPNADVLIGELAPVAKGSASTAPLTFLRALTCSKKNWTAAKRCSGLVAHGFAHHPYDFTAKPTRKPSNPDNVTIGVLSRLTKVLDQLARRKALRTPAGRPLDLYLTEHGYFASGARRLPAATRATYLRESFDIALRHPRVRQMLQYLLVASPERRDLFPTHIIESSGRLHPAYTALKSWGARQRSRLTRPAAIAP